MVIDPELRKTLLQLTLSSECRTAPKNVELSQVQGTINYERLQLTLLSKFESAPRNVSKGSARHSSPQLLQRIVEPVENSGS